MLCGVEMNTSYNHCHVYESYDAVQVHPRHGVKAGTPKKGQRVEGFDQDGSWFLVPGSWFLVPSVSPDQWRGDTGEPSRIGSARFFPGTWER